MNEDEEVLCVTLVSMSRGYEVKSDNSFEEETIDVDDNGEDDDDDDYKTVDGEHDFDPILPKQEAPHPGTPNLPNDTFLKQFNLFSLFLPRSMVKTIVSNTNSYAKTHSIEGDRVWKRLTIDEFYIWIGVSLYMGLCRQPNTESYWKTDGLCGPHTNQCNQ